MVGLVVVSHSRALAEAVCELARQAAPAARVYPAGGAGEEGKVFGTDALAIADALREADSPEGVLVLMDLGSAVLSAETAMELVEPELAARCRLSWAPLVEGAISAAVQASVGGQVESIQCEARGALDAKREHLSQEESPSEAQLSRPDGEGTVPPAAFQQTYTVTSLHGLHARPAAMLVRLASKYRAEARFRKKNGTWVSSQSLNAIARLNIRQGEPLQVATWGPEAEELLVQLGRLIADDFGEGKPTSEPRSAESAAATPPEDTDDTPPQVDTEVAESPIKQKPTVRLICASPGITMGEIWRRQGTELVVFASQHCTDAEAEVAKFHDLLARAESRLEIEVTGLEHGPAREILEMHQILLRDPELRADAIRQIQEERRTAAYAWHQTCLRQSASYRAIEDNPYLQERAADFIDIDQRVLREAEDVVFPDSGEIPSEALLFADEVYPAELSLLDMSRIRGIVSRRGGQQTHAAIIARSRGLPMVCGYEQVDEATGYAIIDAVRGRVLLQPDETTLADYRNRVGQMRRVKQQLLASAHHPARTLDGVDILCLANVGGERDLEQLAPSGAEGVGLLRSEFLFLDASRMPDEEEQTRFYRHALESLPGKRVVVRLLDVGSDKQLPYFPSPLEANPALGLRGVRFCLKYRSLLRTQLRALLRAAPYGNLALMIPMVSEVQELRQVGELLRREDQILRDRGIAPSSLPPLGVMIETPASVHLADQLARDADFFSVGTNDLSQYTLAAERENKALDYLCDAAHPALLRTLQQLFRRIEGSPVPVSVCGESAADTTVVPLLLGLGIECLSVVPVRLPLIKYLIRKLSRQECQNLLRRAVDCASAEEVRDLVRSELPWLEQLDGL